MGGFHPGLGLGNFGTFGSFGAVGGAKAGDFGLLGDEPPVEEPDLGIDGVLHDFDDDPGEESDLGARGLGLLQGRPLPDDDKELEDDGGDLSGAGLLLSSQLSDLPELEDPDEPRDELEDPNDEPPDDLLPRPPPLLSCKKRNVL